MTVAETKNGDEPMLVLDDIVQEFAVNRRGSLRRATVSAVSGVSLSVRKGHVLAVVGETGSGKTTLVRTVLGAPAPKSGTIKVAGRDVTARRGRGVKERGRLVQMIFQDPMSALDPTWTVERILSEPLSMAGKMSRTVRRERIATVLARVGLKAEVHGARKPSELSGGQAQRVAIARALIAAPELVICDEPVTALDAASQAQVLALLAELKNEFGLTYLFITHDLAVVQNLADSVATMYLGKVCETAPTSEMFSSPAHPYTAALLSAIPSFTPTERPRIRLLGEPPSPLDPPSGCRFRTRCPFAQEICATQEPRSREIAPGREVACHFPLIPVVEPAETVSAA